MEIGPTCHYMMGGIQVDADSQETVVPGSSQPAKSAGGMHGANRLGGNSLSDLVVFGRRAGIGAAEYIESGQAATAFNQSEVDSAIEAALAPLSTRERREPVRHSARPPRDDAGERRHHSYRRRAGRSDQEPRRVHRAREEHFGQGRARVYNPGWNLATDLPAMITVCKSVTLGATLRKESRGGHTREDFPNPSPEFGKINLAQSSDGGTWDSPINVVESPLLDFARRSESPTRGDEVMAHVTMRVWRGDASGGDFENYTIEQNEGEVVLDVIHRIQATEAPDLACRWNCKAGKCGSCSAEINGKPRLMCMTRMDELPDGTRHRYAHEDVPHHS
jgi:succinate dehydrogenase / fumarate reductase flavoprotein subunit